MYYTLHRPSSIGGFLRRARCWAGQTPNDVLSRSNSSKTAQAFSTIPISSTQQQNGSRLMQKTCHHTAHPSSFDDTKTTATRQRKSYAINNSILPITKPLSLKAPDSSASELWEESQQGERVNQIKSIDFVLVLA